VHARIAFDAAFKGGEDSDALVPASSPYEASEIDGFIDVGWMFGVEHAFPRSWFRERPTSPGSQESISVQRLRVDGPASSEALGVQLAGLDETTDLNSGDTERAGRLVDTELIHSDTVEQIR